MTLIERWTIEGGQDVANRALINVAGPTIPPHAQRSMVLESDYEALADEKRQLQEEVARVHRDWRGAVARVAELEAENRELRSIGLKHEPKLDQESPR